MRRCRSQRGVSVVGDRRYLTVQADYHKVQVPVDEIMYVTIEGRKTKITRKDGSSLRTNRSLRDVYGDLPGEEFSSVNRGIVVSKSYVRSEKKGIITMQDGTQFKRRVRAERTERPKVVPAVQEEAWRSCPVEELDWWLGEMPLPMCILELVYRGRGGSPGFVVRYCNRAMEELENVRFADVKDQPIERLGNLDRSKRLTVFADVAINGSSQTMEDFWGSTGRFMRVHCYRPQSGCCALVLTDLTREHNVVEKLFLRGQKG